MLEDTVIHADETTVQVLKENGKAAASASRMWVYASWEGSKKPIRIFGRSWEKVKLDDFRQEIDHYINWYNHKRIKLSLGGMSPIEYRHHLGFAA